LATLSLSCGGGRSSISALKPGTPDTTPTASPLAALLPAPGTLVNSGTHAASGATLLSHYGAETDPALAPRNATVNGTALNLEPAWTAVAPHPDGLALALYRFTVSGYQGPTDLHVDWSGSASFSDRFVAVADFPRERWNFMPVSADGVIALTPEQFAAGTAPNAIEFLAVAISIGDQSSVLGKIRIGAEQGPLNITGVTPTSVPVWRTTTFMPVYTGEEPASWEWTFGGAGFGSTYKGRTPSVYMSTKGVFNAKLKATDAHGNVTEFPFQLSVLDHSLIAPQISAVLPTAGETGSQQLFYPFEDGGAAATYSWNFGGGATPNTSNDDWPSVTLGAPGAYDASVTASNGHGSSTVNFTLYVVPVGGALPPQLYDIGYDNVYQLNAGQSVKVSAQNDTTAGGGTPDTYSWDFGGGAVPNTSSEASPQIFMPQAGVFHATVTATNAAGSSTLHFDMTVLQPAAPHLTGTSSQEPETGIALSIGAVNDGGMGYAWHWDFGGACSPNVSTDETPLITPLAAGIYHCTVIANNNAGSSMLHFDLTVADPEIPHLTLLNSTELTTTIEAFLYANNDGGAVADWSWNFGGVDPAKPTSTEQYPSVVPTAAGTYHGSVTASNVSGSSTLEFTLTVTDMAPPVLDQVFPGQVVEAQTTSFFANTNCNFQMTWTWDFGGGCTPNTSTEQFPQVQAGAPGTYNCMVTATNAGGTATFPFTLEVKPNQ
jgi:PKD repeat protein